MTNLASSVRGLGRAILDLIYPPSCIICGAGDGADPPRHLCGKCLAAMPLIGPDACPRCGDALGPHSEGRRACGSCARRKGMIFRATVAACRYETGAREMVHSLKYSRDLRAVHWMAQTMAARMAEAPWRENVEVVAPVPIHWTRRVRRRFNQSDLLARALLDGRAWHYDEYLLRRTRRTPAQATLALEQREKNVEGAFALNRNRDVEGKSVLIVDDVMTTCATVTECARVLRDAGAKAVYAAVFAR